MAMGLKELLEKYALPVSKFIGEKGRKPAFDYSPSTSKIEVDKRALKNYLSAVVIAEKNGYTKDENLRQRIVEDGKKKFGIKVSINKDGKVSMSV